MPTRRITLTSLVLALGVTLASLSLVPTAASASVAQGYINGLDTVTDDWGDEGPIDHNSNRTSNATALWQLVLKSDGFYSGAIDCDFGPATQAATKAWQQNFGLPADGSAGGQTLGRADDFLYPGSGDNVIYDGYQYDVTFHRTGGKYYLLNGGSWHVVYYTSSSAC